MKKIVLVILILGLAGAFIKIIGSVMHSSKALFVDALTSLANIIALVSTTHYYRISLQPPDTDHPYGHFRFGFGGTIVSLIAYGYVAGVVSMELLYTREYTVEFNAVYYAVSGLIIYSLAVLLSLKIGGFYKAYGYFTVGELYESFVTIIATFLGAIYYYLIDYIGAIGLSIYLFYQLTSICRETIYSIARDEHRID